MKIEPFNANTIDKYDSKLENWQLNDGFKVGLNILVGLGEVTGVEIDENVVAFDKMQHDMNVNELFKIMLPPGGI